MINKYEARLLLAYLGWFVHADSCADITVSKLNTTLDIMVSSVDDWGGLFNTVDCVGDILKINDLAEDGLM